MLAGFDVGAGAFFLLAAELEILVCRGGEASYIVKLLNPHRHSSVYAVSM